MHLPWTSDHSAGTKPVAECAVLSCIHFPLWRVAVTRFKRDKQFAYNYVEWQRDIGDVSDERRQPVEFGLLDPSPNPFNPATVIRFSLPRAAQTTLTVFDVAGRRVATLTDGLLPAGNHAVHFNGGALPSGLYFCSLRSGPFSATQKLCLVK